MRALPQRAAEAACSRRAALIATLLVAVYIVTVWAMGAKPT